MFAHYIRIFVSTESFQLDTLNFFFDEECGALVGKENNISDINGIIKCKIVAPKNLYHPVLPIKMHGRLLFSLCRSCCENSLKTFCTRT